MAQPMFLFSEILLFPCAYKQLFGIDCPMCGFQRSLLLLLRGNFRESFFMYPALVPTLALIGFFGMHLISKKMVTKKFLLTYGAVVLSLIIVSYAVKLANG
jgi:hypothetical protein